VTVHQLSKAEARRIAVQAQLLDGNRPTDLLDVVRHLTLVRIEPTAAVAPSAELVLWTRLASAFSPQELWDAVDEQRLVELRGMLRPVEDMVLFRAEMAEWPGSGELKEWQEYRREWVEDNEACRLDVLERLRADGPLRLRDLPDTCVVPWDSSGWNKNRNMTMLLDFMVQRGEVAAAGGTGRDRLWDLASRVYPDEPPVPSKEARKLRERRRLHALGIARSSAPACPGEPQDVGEGGEPAVVEGGKGTWRVDPCYLGTPFSGRAALLSPFDQLVHDRKRIAELFDFDYQLEMFKPAAKRRWGYFALPVLYGDRLVGKLDAAADRRAGVLHVNAIHQDEPFTDTMADAVRREVEDLARWLELELELPDAA
jgi:uncharacterized protein YcaQ